MKIFPLNRQHNCSCQKGGRLVGFYVQKRIKGTKINALVKELPLPLTFIIGSGREHEGRRLISILETISIKHGRGRPRKRPKVLYSYKRYNMPINRFYLHRKHILYQMPEDSRKKLGEGPLPIQHKKVQVKDRKVQWIKAFRRIIIRYDKLPQVYMGLVHLACIIYLRILQ